MGTKIWKSFGSEKENEIKHWQYAYEKVCEHLNLIHDHYFKRTQILMFTIQIGLATAFIKLLVTDFTNPNLLLCKLQAYYVFCVISFLGVVFCFIWLLMIKGHWEGLEYCRCYMRYIEGHLMKLGVPLAVFRAESVISYLLNRINFDDEERKDKDNHNKYQKVFPYRKKKADIGLMNLEKWVVRIIRLAWVLCFSIFLCQVLKNYNTIFPCICSILIIILFIGYMIYESKKDKKEKIDNKSDKIILFKDLENISNEKFGIFLKG